MQQDSLSHLLYISTASRAFDETSLPALLDHARRTNAANGITGLLLYGDGCFMQLLEGKPDAVQATFDRIERDQRHHSVIVIVDELTVARAFADWSMAYRRVDGPDFLCARSRLEIGDGMREVLREFWQRLG